MSAPPPLIGVLPIRTSEPSGYLGVQHWADGLGTAYFALLAPAAIGCLGLAIRRTRALPAWTGYVVLTATVLLLGQYAAFRGALPFPQFLAFIAIGIAALACRPPAIPSQTREPAHQAPIQGCLNIPSKRHDRPDATLVLHNSEYGTFCHRQNRQAPGARMAA